jgi:hypothetical protein
MLRNILLLLSTLSLAGNSAAVTFPLHPDDVDVVGQTEYLARITIINSSSGWAGCALSRLDAPANR